MAWYTSGTISLTNGSTTVTGSGTSWVAGAGIGEALYAPDGRIYEIADIASNTSLTLASAYLGTTQSGQAYKIIPTQSYIRDLAADAASLISQYAGIASGAGAGKFTDGALATPGIAFASDVDTGLFRSTTNTLQIVAGGAAALTATTSGVSVAGNTTLGDASTDTVQVNGYMGVGGSTSSDVGLYITSPSLIGASQYGVWSAPVANSSATALVVGALLTKSTAAASFTTSNAISLRIGNGVKGAGSTITTNTGIEVLDQTNGTNNYGITSLVSSGTNKWNIYASGTAANYFAGSVQVGSATALSVAGVTPKVQLSSTSTSVENSSLALLSYSEAANPNSSVLHFGRGGSSSIGATNIGGAGMSLGKISFSAGDGAALIGSSLIESQLDSASSSGIAPGRLIFSTANTSGALTERLRIDSSGNLGLGVTPSAWSGVAPAIDVGTAGVSIYGSGFSRNAYNNGTNWIYKSTAAATLQTTSSGQHVWYTAPSGTAGNAISFTQAMTLDASGNLGIGTSSPLFKLDARGASGTGISYIETTTGNANRIQLGATSGLGYINATAGTGSPSLQFQVADAERMRLDQNGNLGLGVTPSAWGASSKVIEFGYAGSSLFASSANNTSLLSNAYYDGTVFKYASSAAAHRYQQQTAGHVWYVAPSGTAGNAITFTQVLAIEKDKSLALQGATSQTGAGISFPSTQVASTDANTLDDYEEGTFTPTIVGVTTAGVGTYSVQVGRYTKIGNRVFFSIALTWSAHTGTGTTKVGGLPFTSANNSNGFNFLSIGANNLTYSDQITAYTDVNAATLSLATFASAGSLTLLPIDSAASVFISGHYDV